MRQLESAKERDLKLSITYLCQLLEVSRKGYYKHTFTEQDEDVKVASVLHYCQYVRSWLPRAGVDTLQECTVLQRNLPSRSRLALQSARSQRLQIGLFF